MSELIERIRELDSGGQLDAVLGMPDQLRDALWRIESARLQPVDAGGVLICGMGGSAIGGDLAAAVLGDRCTRPLLTVRGYELPVWTTPDWLVLCSSYSGETEETLACFDAAGALGASRLVATTGGALADAARDAKVPVIGLPATFAPRAAVAYMLAVAAEAAAFAGVAPRIHMELDSAAAHLEGEGESLIRRAAEIAARLEGTVPVIYGADLTGAVGRRWKTQVNENSKLPAFWAEVPEADHNELAGWAGSPPGAMSAVFLEDADQHPRQRLRSELTARMIGASAPVVRVETEGPNRAGRLLWAVALGDLVSLHLAAMQGIDPTPVEAIEQLKHELPR